MGTFYFKNCEDWKSRDYAIKYSICYQLLSVL